MTYVKVNVNKPDSGVGAGGDKKDIITLFDFEDVLSFPARDSKGIVISGDITLNPGAYMIKIYGTQDTIKASVASEGDPDKKGYIHTLEFQHPGSEQEIEEFLQNWHNKNIGAVIERCSENHKKQYGTPCAPLQLTVASDDSKDSNNSTLTLKSTQKSQFRPAIYEGALSYDTVKGTVPANDTSPTVAAGEGEYQLTTGTVSSVNITTLDNAVDGNVYKLLGSGGTYPSTIDDGDDFLLKNGTTWTAASGAWITFKAFKDGSSTFKFIELSRS